MRDTFLMKLWLAMLSVSSNTHGDCETIGMNIMAIKWNGLIDGFRLRSVFIYQTIGNLSWFMKGTDLV